LLAYTFQSSASVRGILAGGRGWLAEFVQVLKILVAREDVLVAGLSDLAKEARLLIQLENTKPS
jgi:hypothetical protein